MLTAALKDPDDYARAEAAFCLGLMGADSRPVAGELRAALKDPFTKVRFHVAAALLAIDPEDAAVRAVFFESLQKTGLPPS